MGTGQLPPAAQNATGNWIKIVQRVPVRILLKPEQIREHPLRIGLSAYVPVPDPKTLQGLSYSKGESTPGRKRQM